MLCLSVFLPILVSAAGAPEIPIFRLDDSEITFFNLVDYAAPVSGDQRDRSSGVSKFTHADREVMNRVVIENPTDVEDWIFGYIDGTPRPLSFSVTTSKGTRSVEDFTYRMPIGERAVPSNTVNVRLRIPPGETAVMITNQLPVGAFITTLERFRRIHEVRLSAQIFMYGMFFALILYHLFLYFLIKTPDFGFFSLFLLLMTLMLMYQDDFLAYVFPEHWHFFLSYPACVTMAQLTFAAFLLFFDAITQMKNVFPRLSRATRLLAAVLAGIIVFSLFLDSIAYFILTNLSTIPFAVLFFYSAIRLALKKNRMALLALLSSAPLIVVSMSAILQNLGITNYSGVYVLFSLYGAFSIIPLALSFAVASNIRHLQRQREEALLERDRSRRTQIEKTRFFSRLAHEIKTPLTVLVNQIPRLTGLGDWEAQETLHTIEAAAARIRKDVENFFDLDVLEQSLPRFDHFKTTNASTSA